MAQISRMGSYLRQSSHAPSGGLSKEWSVRKFLHPRDLRDLRFFPSPFLG